MENSMKVPQTIANGTATWFSNSTSGSLAEGNKNTNSKRHMQPCVHCSTIHKSQDMETAQVATGRWRDKEDMVLLYSGILFSLQTEGNLAICGSTDEPWGLYGEWSRSDRETQIHHMLSLHAEPEKQTNIEFINTDKRLVATRGGGGEGERWSKGTSFQL